MNHDGKQHFWANEKETLTTGKKSTEALYLDSQQLSDQCQRPIDLSGALYLIFIKVNNVSVHKHLFLKRCLVETSFYLVY